MSDNLTSPQENDRDRDELVAYLDGELEAPAAEAIERQLAEDANLRSQMRELERVWDSLDQLPRVPVDESFVKTTVEMVAVAAEDDVNERKAALPKRQLLRRLGTSGTLAACVLAGFLLAFVLWKNPDNALVADLPIVENLDLYLQADSLEFIERLHERRIDWNGGDNPQPIAYYVESDEDRTTEARRERIANLTEHEKYELKNNFERFTSRSPEERQRLREFHDAIISHQDGEQLLDTLANYQHWLSAEVSAGARADLAALATEQRIERIERMVEDQRNRRPSQWLKELQAKLDSELSKTDQQTIRNWMTQRRGEEQRDRPRNGRRAEDSRSKYRRERSARESPADRAPARQRGWFEWMPRPEEIEELREKLSVEAQRKLEDAGGKEEQEKLLSRWIRSIGMSNIMRRRMSNRRGATIEDEELMEFFNSDKLTAAERQKLLDLPREEMRRRLLQRYAREFGVDLSGPPRRGEGRPPFPEGRPRRGPRGGPPGDHPGPESRGPRPDVPAPIESGPPR